MDVCALFGPARTKGRGTKAWREIREETNDENPNDPECVFVWPLCVRGHTEREKSERNRRRRSYTGADRVTEKERG